jgi:hypothetical protein
MRWGSYCQNKKIKTMESFFKKALGLFVEVTADEKAATVAHGEHLPLQSMANENVPVSLTKDELDKFEKHFEGLFSKANLPGPDYFEFWRMMETLGTHVPDEKARMAAVFATLQVQGLSKEKLLAAAQKYYQVVQKDQQEFQKAVDEKIKLEIENRKSETEALQKAIASHTAMIQKLTAEIAQHEARLNQLKQETHTEETKLNQNRNGYHAACNAMLVKIESDIKKIEINL